ncbi:MAG: PfkB family carbohydrate kinase, partial [Eubacteriales bacterium]|nr:PfkB family carbohydrate kinase [Eubacteriales bacterium]
MILSIGEILADLIGEKNDGALTFRAFCGGAPFNLAVNAKQSGATVGFVGRVGNDVIGRFVTAEAEKANLDSLDIQTDEKRNTTIAFVTLMNGERDFAFNRHDTADFNIDFDKIDFAKYKNLNIVHLGSLMLSEEKGRAFAKRVADKTKEIGAKLSFDVNFRKDIFRDFDAAKRAYEPFVKRADIVKFSEDELLDFTGISGIDAAAESLCDKDKLILVTLGKNGSA